MRPRDSRGLFITFEGGEGAGKSTLIASLKEYLEAQSLPVVSTREPGGCALAEDVRRCVLDCQGQVGKRAELLLFLAARAQHVKELIEPALNQGKVVLCDRFNDSTLAYQGGARGLGEESVKALCHFATGGLEPDLTLYLDVDPVVGLDRTRKTEKDMAAADQVDRMESEGLTFHRQVRQAYLDIAEREPFRVHTVDASQSLQDVLRQAIAIIETQMKTRI